VKRDGTVQCAHAASRRPCRSRSISPATPAKCERSSLIFAMRGSVEVVRRRQRRVRRSPGQQLAFHRFCRPTFHAHPTLQTGATHRRAIATPVAHFDPMKAGLPPSSRAPSYANQPHSSLPRSTLHATLSSDAYRHVSRSPGKIGRPARRPRKRPGEHFAGRASFAGDSPKGDLGAQATFA
jgi:hypothetical protein